MKLTASLFLLITASSAFAQSPAIDIRVTGEHRIAANETPDVAKELALVDAERKTLSRVTALLRDRADVTTLRLTPDRLEPYLAALLDVREHSTAARASANQTMYQVDVRLHLDTTETARRLTRLRKDQEASSLLERTWKEMQDSQLTLPALHVKRAVMQIAVALARTEEAPIGGRSPSKEGRARARQLADAALALSPDSADAHAAMGDVLTDARDLEAAEAEYRKALAAIPNSSSAHWRLGNALLLQSKFTDAEAEFREAIRLDGRSVQAHTDLGLTLRSQRKLADAAAEYHEAIALDPDFVEAHNGLAVTLASQGRMPDAVTEFRQIVRIDPDSAIGYYNLSFALAEMDKDDESADAIREVIRINPNHYNARYNMGELFRLEGKYDESAAQFREYLRLAPDTPQNRRNIGRAKTFIKTFENE